MTIAILATGDELIHGDTLNTNSHAIAQTLSSEGLPLGLQLVCSDKESELYESFEFLSKQHEVIIVTGGLGPTSDDRTRFALASFLKIELVEFSTAIEQIRNRLGLREDQLNHGNRQQALFPAEALLLPNHNGTALGCYYPYHSKIYILLPGPPRECLPMFHKEVLPLLQKRAHSTKQLLKWRLFGVAESQIAEEIDQALAHLDCQTGYRLETPYVECKVRCLEYLKDQVFCIVSKIASPYLIATVEQKASELLYETILKKQIPISIIDEATGGILQTLIQKPNSYPFIKFHREEKALCHFRLYGLEEYWSGKGKKGNTQLFIELRYGENKEQLQRYESHEIPYRSPLVLYYAAEWLSFRLVHLINQLH